jgi:signal transduction histidine kinase
VELLEPVLDEIGRLEKLVKDLLLYSKPIRPSLRWVAWATLCSELRPFVVECIGEYALSYRLESSDLEIETDPDLLKEILLNLLRNSVEALAINGDGEVRLELAPGPPLRITVEDTGPGMAPSLNEHLFEPFYTTKAAGTGLGLNVARKLAQSLGAELTFEPVPPHGTRAELRFAHGQVQHGTYINRG